MAAALAAQPCSWLRLDSASGASVSLAGVARDPAAAMAAVQQAVGAGAGEINLDNVVQVGAPVCDVLDAFRPLRPTARLTSAQSTYAMQPHPPDKNFAPAVITLSPDPAGGLHPAGGRSDRRRAEPDRRQGRLRRHAGQSRPGQCADQASGRRLSPDDQELHPSVCA